MVLYTISRKTRRPLTVLGLVAVNVMKKIFKMWKFIRSFTVNIFIINHLISSSFYERTEYLLSFIYIIHHWTIVRSSYRKLESWPGYINIHINFLFNFDQKCYWSYSIHCIYFKRLIHGMVTWSLVMKLIFLPNVN